MSALFESLTGLALLDPWAWALALLLPLALWLRRRGGGPALRFGPGRLAVGGGLPRTWKLRLLPLPEALQAAALLLVVVALARPVERVELPSRSRGIDILLCLDVSSSMRANDLDPARTRLAVAQGAAQEFIAGRPDDRMGLLRFARYPDVLCPLTLDHRALAGFVQQLEMVAADGLEDRTGIGAAVAVAARMLRSSAGKSKVLILLTDGEENVATAEAPEEIGPLQAARLCEELGVRVYAIAVGVGRRDRSGAWAPLDTSQLQRLAEITGGGFFEARDARAVEGVYATIDRLEKAEFEQRRYELREKFLPFLLAGLGLLLLGRVARATVLEVLP